MTMESPESDDQDSLSDFFGSFASFGNLGEPVNASLSISSHWETSEYRNNVLNDTRMRLYELGDELGRGKFGKVKRGRHIITGS